MSYILAIDTIVHFISTLTQLVSFCCLLKNNQSTRVCHLWPPKVYCVRKKKSITNQQHPKYRKHAMRFTLIFRLLNYIYF